MRSLQSGMNGSEELVKDFETAHDDGEALVKKFFDERMFSTEKSFDATISRNARGISTGLLQEKLDQKLVFEDLL